MATDATDLVARVDHADAARRHDGWALLLDAADRARELDGLRRWEWL